MAILFRPSYPVDHEQWIPLLKDKLSDRDFRVWPDVGNAEDIEYLICWQVVDGDKDAYPNLKAVLSLMAGIDGFLKSTHFPENAPLIRMIDPGMTQSMAEYVLSFVLRFHREHDEMSAIVKEHPWPVPVPKRAHERTIGLLGFGHLGQACAEKLLPVGFNVQGWARTEKDYPDVQCFYGQDQLPEFLKSTDILVCLLPLTNETRDILNKETLSLLPKGASLINVARGPHVVDDDLVTLIKSGHIGRAALDVFRKEPLPLDHAFFEHGNIILTPHIAAVTMPDTGSDVLIETIEMMEGGKTPNGLVDFDRKY